MTKPIPMTIERFFKLLPATKKLHPRLSDGGSIRYGTGKSYACPLSALYKIQTGHHTSMSPLQLEDRFTFREDRRRGNESAVDVLVNAADNDCQTHIATRLRRRMLRTLGLKKKGER